jgi:HlyD family secretion protein
MKRIAWVPGLVWPAVVVACGVGLISAAVWLSRTAAAPAGPRESTAAVVEAHREGVVCFGTVDLERGVSSLYPLQAGRVTDVLVVENQEVAQGAELLRLDDRIARSRLAEAEAAVELAKVQLAEARKQPAVHKRRVAQQRAMRDALSSRVAAARDVVARQDQAAKSVVVNESDRFNSQEKVRELEALERIEVQKLAELEAEDAEVGISRAEYELKAAEARREGAKLAVDECRVTAPRAGTVLRILVAPGDVVGGQASTPAILFAPAGPQVVRATVEQEFAGRVREGEPAVVQDEADPETTWRGRVERVAGWYSQRRTVLRDPSELSDVRTLECVIVLDPGQPRLRLGQSVRVVIGGAD